jgi:hypothetical protein
VRFLIVRAAALLRAAASSCSARSAQISQRSPMRFQEARSSRFRVRLAILKHSSACLRNSVGGFMARSLDRQKQTPAGQRGVDGAWLHSRRSEVRSGEEVVPDRRGSTRPRCGWFPVATTAIANPGLWTAGVADTDRASWGGVGGDGAAGPIEATGGVVSLFQTAANCRVGRPRPTQGDGRGCGQPTD